MLRRPDRRGFGGRGLNGGRRAQWVAAVLVALGQATAGMAAPVPLNLEECIFLGLQHSQLLYNARLRSRAAEAALKEAETARLPSASLSGSYKHLSPLEPGEISLPPPASSSVSLGEQIDNTLAFGLQVQQPVFTGFRIKAGVGQAEAQVAEGRWEVERTRSETVYRIETAFWGLALAGESEAVVKDSLAIVEAQHREVENLIKQGMATRSDLLSVDMRIEETKLQCIEASNARRLQSVQLALLLGLDPAAEIEGRPRFNPPRDEEIMEQEDALIARALKGRPEIAAQLERIRAAEARVEAVRSGWFPSLFVTGGLLVARPNSRLFPPEDVFTATWELGLLASLELGRFSALPAQVKQAELKLAQIRNDLGQLQEGVILEALSSHLALESAREQEQAADSMVSQAEENHRILSEKHRNGLTRTTELLDAALSLQKARLRRTQALVGTELARASLRRALAASSGSGP